MRTSWRFWANGLRQLIHLTAARKHGRRQCSIELSVPLLPAGALGRAANKEAADAFAANTLPIIRELRASGVDSYQGLANTLNRRGIRTARGGQWYATTVMNLLNRKL